MFKCGFIYVAPGEDMNKARAFIPSDEIEMTVPLAILAVMLALEAV